MYVCVHIFAALPSLSSYFPTFLLSYCLNVLLSFDLLIPPMSYVLCPMSYVLSVLLSYTVLLFYYPILLFYCYTVLLSLLSSSPPLLLTSYCHTLILLYSLISSYPPLLLMS
jgi:hypothetical protein